MEAGNVVETEPDDDTVTEADDTGKGGGGGGGGSGDGGGTAAVEACVDAGPFKSAKGSHAAATPSHGSDDFASSIFVALAVNLCRFVSPYNKQ